MEGGEEMGRPARTLSERLAEILGSRAWLVLQCVAVAVLALLDVLLVYAHSDDQSVKVAVSSNDVGLDLFGLSSPFVLLLLADTTLNVFFQSAGTVRFFSRDVLYMDALLDIGTLGGCYISMAVNTSYWSDPLAFRSGSFDDWAAWTTLAKQRSAGVTHAGLMLILFRVGISAYRYHCWRAVLRGKLQDKVQTSRNIRALLLGMTIISTFMFLFVLQLVVQLSVKGAWSAVLSGPRTIADALGQISEESDFMAAAQATVAELGTSENAGSCHTILSVSKGPWRADSPLLSQLHFEHDWDEVKDRMPVAFLVPSDYVVEVSQGSVDMMLMLTRCDWDWSLHVAKIVFTGIILLTVLVVHMLGQSGVLMPLFSLMAVIIAAGSTLNDEGMLVDVGVRQNSDLGPEQAVARVVKAIKLLWKASLRGKAVVNRLLLEANQTMSRPYQELGVMAIFGASDERDRTTRPSRRARRASKRPT